MTRFQFFRRWISFLKIARKWTDIIGVLLVLSVFFYLAPKDVLNANPATGGDTGSHFWPLVTLVKEGLPNWHIRVWNPGNLGGEPHHTHYFPLPYLVMAFLSLFMPLGRAFNIGTVLPLIVFPLCVYTCFRGLKARFPIPLLATLASLTYLYNESFSMWGGNALSTMAGQFAHVYAFDFFLLGIGALHWEMSRRKFPWLSMFLFTGVMLSHFYVVLFLPPVFLAFLLLERGEDFKTRLRKLFWTGIGTLLLSAWFVIPMLHNAKWNTAFGLQWSGAQLFQEAFPKLFWPMAGLVLFFSVLAVGLIWKRRLFEREWKLVIPLLFSLIVICGIYYVIFPGLGLVDVRVFPTMQMSLCFLAAIYVGLFLNRDFPSVWVWFLTLPLIAVSIWWGTRQIYHLPYWMKWNYSGWEAKNAYPDVKNLTTDIKGDFSQGRVIYENSDISNAAGTMRVWEMLPYFAGRSTMESVYMQATILAPAAFYLQALISKTPSCPFPNYQCTSYQVPNLYPYLKLFGIEQLILISPEVRSQADQADFLKKRKEYGIWTLYDSKVPAPLVETMAKQPVFIPAQNFKQEFYQWFMNYKGNENFEVVAPDEDQDKIRAAVTDDSSCEPQLKVHFDYMELKTKCPGKFHYLKFAYHSTWKASTGDKLYLVSPGFIGIIPSQNEVTLRWGQHWLWNLADTVSWLTFFGIAGFLIWSRTRKKQEGRP